MSPSGQVDSFIRAIPGFSVFAGVAESGNYVPLPNDWALALTDIVGSTQAVAEGRYKAVNMAGASAIAALLNAMGRHDFPFVFGGDGALVAVPGDKVDLARDTLAAARAWVSDELGLSMRGALVPMADIRAAGHDVRVAMFRVSDHSAYAMFAGGGTSWAEAAMKAGRFEVPAAPSGTRPDLTGLSCRWSPIVARRGEIASVIVLPAGDAGMDAFRALVGDIVAMAGEQERGGHPVPPEGPELGFSVEGVRAETRALAPRGRRFLALLNVLGQIALTWVLAKLRRGIGSFDPAVYRSDVSANTDFRKFDDGLKMTVELDPQRLARIETRLAEAERAGVCRYGIHRQDSALMTCFVVSPLQRDHLHFIDGAAGGYAMASAALKAKAA